MNHCFPASGKLVSLTEQAIAITAAGTTCVPWQCLQLRWNKEQGNAKSEQHYFSHSRVHGAFIRCGEYCVFSLSLSFFQLIPDGMPF
jgi:hypothetical protein